GLGPVQEPTPEAVLVGVGPRYCHRAVEVQPVLNLDRLQSVLLVEGHPPFGNLDRPQGIGPVAAYHLDDEGLTDLGARLPGICLGSLAVVPSQRVRAVVGVWYADNAIPEAPAGP